MASWCSSLRRWHNGCLRDGICLKLPLAVWNREQMPTLNSKRLRTSSSVGGQTAPDIYRRICVTSVRVETNCLWRTDSCWKATVSSFPPQWEAIFSEIIMLVTRSSKKMECLAGEGFLPVDHSAVFGTQCTTLEVARCRRWFLSNKHRSLRVACIFFDDLVTSMIISENIASHCGGNDDTVAFQQEYFS